MIVLELNLMGQDKLRVILTPFDMIKYDLTCDKIDYDNTETRKAVWSILDYAKHETGFDAATGRICIQVYPEKNGGCEIYITKLQKNKFPSACKARLFGKKRSLRRAAPASKAPILSSDF